MKGNFLLTGDHHLNSSYMITTLKKEIDLEKLVHSKKNFLQVT